MKNFICSITLSVLLANIASAQISQTDAGITVLFETEQQNIYTPQKVEIFSGNSETDIIRKNILTAETIYAIQSESYWGEGLLIGLGSGLITGAAIGYLTYEPCSCLVDFGPGLNALGGALLGGAGGAVIGLVIGLSIAK